MQAVGIGPVEVLAVFLHHGEESRGGIQVDDGHGPDVGRPLHIVYIAVEELAAAVHVVLGTLPVLFVGIESGAMDGREQHNLLGGEHLLERVEGGVDASAVGVGSLVGDASHAAFHAFRIAVSILHVLQFFVKPLSSRHGVVIVVGTHEDEDGIEVVAMLLFQQVGLPGDVVPLPSAHTVDVGGDVEPLLQESPVLGFRSLVARVGDGIAEIGHPFSLPGMAHEFLGHGGHCRHDGEQGENQFLFHCCPYHSFQFVFFCRCLMACPPHRLSPTVTNPHRW